MGEGSSSGSFERGPGDRRLCVVACVDGDDGCLDLLFYHLGLRCYVVVELKAVPFRPEFAGQINFYCSVVDDRLRVPGHDWLYAVGDAVEETIDAAAARATDEASDADASGTRARTISTSRSNLGCSTQW